MVFSTRGVKSRPSARITTRYPGIRSSGKVLVADNNEIGIQFTDRMNRVINQFPKQGSLSDHVICFERIAFRPR